MNNSVILNFLEKLKILIDEFGEKESAFLTNEVVGDISGFIDKGDDFFNSNIIGINISRYIESVHAKNNLKYDEETFDATYFLWSIVDAYSDDETRELVLSSIKDGDSFSNFKVYIQGMRHNS